MLFLVSAAGKGGSQQSSPAYAIEGGKKKQRDSFFLAGKMIGKGFWAA